MIHKLEHEFVVSIPEKLQPGRLYVSVTFATIAHLCCCGCGNEVITPLSPTDWRLVFDGVSVSLTPSIGNWSFPCRSHYWVRRGRIVRARPLTQEAVDRGRARDIVIKQRLQAIYDPGRLDRAADLASGGRG